MSKENQYFKAMARKSLNEFKKLYNAHFLTTSLSSYKVGYKMDWDGLFHRRMDVDEFYFTNLFPVANPEKEILSRLLDERNQEPVEDAQMVAVDIDRKQDIEFALNIPSLNNGDLSAVLEFEKVISMSYENVKARSLNGRSLGEIVEVIQAMDRSDFRHVAHLRFLKVLYYADFVSITVNTNYSAEAKAKIVARGIDVEVKASGENKETLVLKGAANCPFATVIESVGDLL